jgi:hypothetical protein
VPFLAEYQALEFVLPPVRAIHHPDSSPDAFSVGADAASMFFARATLDVQTHAEFEEAT